MKCPKCGKEARGDFCVVCGARVNATAPSRADATMDSASLYQLLDEQKRLFEPMNSRYDELAELQEKEEPGLVKRFLNDGIDKENETGCLVALRQGERVVLLLSGSLFLLALFVIGTAQSGAAGQWIVLAVIVIAVAVLSLYKKAKKQAVQNEAQSRADERNELLQELSDHYQKQSDAVVPFQYANAYAIQELMVIAQRGRASSVNECIAVLERDLANAAAIQSSQDTADRAKRMGLLKVALVVAATSLPRNVYVR